MTKNVMFWSWFDKYVKLMSNDINHFLFSLGYIIIKSKSIKSVRPAVGPYQVLPTMSCHRLTFALKYNGGFPKSFTLYIGFLVFYMKSNIGDIVPLLKQMYESFCFVLFPCLKPLLWEVGLDKDLQVRSKRCRKNKHDLPVSRQWRTFFIDL